jgi:predicted adenylyl cyclase CyaB
MEIEAKIRLKNHSQFRCSLKSAGATFVGRALEKNWLYDYPDSTLAKADKLLRLREDGRVYFTFKGPRQKSEYKEREEIEFDFPDVSTARSLCENIGFSSWLYYEKVRETWKLDNCEVVIDELPELGIFTEIEGPNKREIEKAIKKLKLPHKYISTTYVELLQKNAAETNTNTQEFRFSPNHEFQLADNREE